MKERRRARTHAHDVRFEMEVCRRDGGYVLCLQSPNVDGREYWNDETRAWGHSINATRFRRWTEARAILFSVLGVVDRRHGSNRSRRRRRLPGELPRVVTGAEVPFVDLSRSGR